MYAVNHLCWVGVFFVEQETQLKLIFLELHKKINVFTPTILIKNKCMSSSTVQVVLSSCAFSSTLAAGNSWHFIRGRDKRQ